MKHFKAFLAMTAAAGALGLASNTAMAGIFDSDDFSPEQLATIKVTMTEAIAKAEALQKGTVIKAELEDEGGKLMYEVELLDNGKEMEVMIDAVSGNAIPEYY